MPDKYSNNFEDSSEKYIFNKLLKAYRIDSLEGTIKVGINFRIGPKRDLNPNGLAANLCKTKNISVRLNFYDDKKPLNMNMIGEDYGYYVTLEKVIKHKALIPHTLENLHEARKGLEAEMERKYQKEYGEFESMGKITQEEIFDFAYAMHLNNGPLKKEKKKRASKKEKIDIGEWKTAIPNEKEIKYRRVSKKIEK